MLSGFAALPLPFVLTGPANRFVAELTRSNINQDVIGQLLSCRTVFYS